MTPPDAATKLQEAAYSAVNYLTYLQANLTDPAERIRAEAQRDSLDEAAKAYAQAVAAAVREYQVALDGTHYHHKAYEPLCTHCRAAMERLNA
jgi:hypothetical protein